MAKDYYAMGATLNDFDKAYESMRATLNAFKQESQRLCADGTTSADKCKQIQIAFDEVVDLYYLLGSVAIKAITTGDLKEYKEVEKSITELLIELENIIKEGNNHGRRML